jgi:hypothetical protein
MMRQGVLLGLHPEELPHDCPELERRLREYDEMLCLTPAAAAAINIFEHPPLPRHLRPGWRFVFAASASLLPPPDTRAVRPRATEGAGLASAGGSAARLHVGAGNR